MMSVSLKQILSNEYFNVRNHRQLFSSPSPLDQHSPSLSYTVPYNVHSCNWCELSARLQYYKCTTQTASYLMKSCLVLLTHHQHFSRLCSYYTSDLRYLDQCNSCQFFSPIYVSLFDKFCRQTPTLSNSLLTSFLFLYYSSRRSDSRLSSCTVNFSWSR